MISKIKEILLKKAPLIVASLLDPATEEEINLLRLIVGNDIPQDLIDLYSFTKGQDPKQAANFAYGVAFLSVNKTIEIIQSIGRDTDEIELNYVDSEIDKSFTFAKTRIPIADDCASCLICVDIKPSENGNFGQVILIDYENGVAFKLADSISEYVSNFHNDLCNGMYSLSEDALEDGVQWLVPDREIDPINWFNSSKWQHINVALSALGGRNGR
ncbi:SMI1/KNR4 family protein [Vibrio anguillarum]|uniref:Knr4/Smi1-like domain-containing protein n=1 Tax=Vibrio anguillarum TaxID=55601 RepID=A0ABR9Z7K0_VIBAN|nr:SMI1/KNR4 family protein [Vibrio anguillarum]MBF4374418.1 hypothetical protein [Vibrio anguillarum]